MPCTLLLESFLLIPFGQRFLKRDRVPAPKLFAVAVIPSSICKARIKALIVSHPVRPFSETEPNPVLLP